MLVLTRRVGQNIEIKLKSGEIITVSSLGVNGKQTKIGITAPADVKIMREELLTRDRAGGA